MFDYGKITRKKKPTAKDIFKLTALEFVIQCKDIFTNEVLYDGLTTAEIKDNVNRLRDSYINKGGDYDTLTHYYNIYALMYEQLNQVIRELETINADLFTLAYYQQTLLKDIGTDRESDTVKGLKEIYTVNIARIKNNILGACKHIRGYNVFIDGILSISDITEIAYFKVMDYVKPTAFIKEVRLNGVVLNNTNPPTHNDDGTPNIEGLKVANDIMLSYSEPLRNYKPYGDYMTLPSLYTNEVYTEILREVAGNSNNKEALNEVITLLSLNLDKCKLKQDEQGEFDLFVYVTLKLNKEPMLKDYSEILRISEAITNCEA